MSAARGFRPGTWLLAAGGLASVAAVAAVVLLTGTPGAQRLARLDATRVQDLARIEQAALNQLRREGAAPATLDAVRGVDLRRSDPVTGAPYGYRLIAPGRLQLCAVFATDSTDLLRQAAPGTHRDWPHGQGETCFERHLAPSRGADGPA